MRTVAQVNDNVDAIRHRREVFWTAVYLQGHHEKYREMSRDEVLTMVEEVFEARKDAHRNKTVGLGIY